MRQRGYGRDRGLTYRMLLTTFLLGLVYLAFIGLLVLAGIQPLFIFGIAIVMVIFQYFGSDKLVLATTRAKVVTPQEEPALHATVERLVALADMPPSRTEQVSSAEVLRS